MSAPITIPQKIVEDTSDSSALADQEPPTPTGPSSFSSSPPDVAHSPVVLPQSPTMSSTPLGSPRLSRHPSFSNSSSYQEDWEAIPPLEKLTIIDLLENLALPHHLEKISQTIHTQTVKVKRQRDALRSRGNQARDRVVEEWRRRVPTAEEQLKRYQKRMQANVGKLGRQWNETRVVTLREKIVFLAGVLNIFISGYLIGGYPELFHIWYTAQLLYFMPLRFYTYRKKGYHYFLADLCYFVNMLSLLSIWVWPNSRRLFISAYCLAYGNNAVAIAMWRNSLVFHSMDKVVSLFIHIMPPVAFHCIVHLIPDELQQARYPAVWEVRHSSPGGESYYSLLSMIFWSSIPYATWQLSYHFFISVRKAKQIAAGRPTSFTWLRKSYSKVWIGKFVLSLPEFLQEPAFMMIQYVYALLTMMPCPLWFWYRYLSGAFLTAVFCWSIWNGATYYIDVFGKRFQKELEAMKREVAKWQHSPELLTSPMLTPLHDPSSEVPSVAAAGGDIAIGAIQESHILAAAAKQADDHARTASIDRIPLLVDESVAMTTGLDGSAKDVTRERKTG